MSLSGLFPWISAAFVSGMVFVLFLRRARRERLRLREKISALENDLERERQRLVEIHQAASAFEMSLHLREQELKSALWDASVYKTAIDQSAIVAITDRLGTITHVNDLFCKTSGYCREELIGANHRMLNSGYHPREFFEGLWRTISSGEVWRGEIRNRRKDGQLYWVYTVIIPFVSESRIERYFAARFDITEKKEMEHKLLQSAKMASLGEMAGGIAHEINNPLASICLDTTRIKIAANQGNLVEVIDAAQEINDTIFRVSSIVKALKTIARDGERDPSVIVPLQHIVDGILPLCQEKFRMKGIPIYISRPPEAVLCCRPTQIMQALMNLLNNAYDAIEKLEEKWVRIDFGDDSERVEISVTDSGTGIPESIREKVMEPFFTTKEVGKGTGLGLSISKAIIESHYGTFFIDKECTNTRFAFQLPKSNQAQVIPDAEGLRVFQKDPVDS